MNYEKVVATQIGEIAIGPKDKVGDWMSNLIVTFKSLHFRFEPITDEEKLMIDKKVLKS